VRVSAGRGGWIDNLPDWGLYGATANINVTLTLTILTFLIYNYEGVRVHGLIGYFRTLIPEAPRAIKPVIFALELLSQLLRLVSLSVRLFANMVAGHLLLIVAAGCCALLGQFPERTSVPFARFLYLLEW